MPSILRHTARRCVHTQYTPFATKREFYKAVTTIDPDWQRMVQTGGFISGVACPNIILGSISTIATNIWMTDVYTGVDTANQLAIAQHPSKVNIRNTELLLNDFAWNYTIGSVLSTTIIMIAFTGAALAGITPLR
jgi:hypothetical protein